MAILLRKLSLTRVYIVIALLLVALFCISPFLPYPEELYPGALYSITSIAWALVLCVWGGIGLLLSRRGEPIRELSANVVIAPCWCIMFLASGNKHFRFVALVVFALVIFATAMLSLKRAKQIGIA